MPYCRICHKHYFEDDRLNGGPHVCPPFWLVIEEGDTYEDAQRVFASSADEAAAAYVEKRDQDAVSFSSERTVLVAKHPEDDEEDNADWSALEWTTYQVVGEMYPSYTAEKKR